MTYCCTELLWRIVSADSGSWTVGRQGCSCPLSDRLAQSQPASLERKTSLPLDVPYKYNYSSVKHASMVPSLRLSVDGQFS